MDEIITRTSMMEQELVAAKLRATTERDARLAAEVVSAQQNFELSQAIDGIPSAAPRPQAAQSSNADTRLLAKTEEFNGAEKSWKDWKFTFKAYMAAVHRSFARELKEAIDVDNHEMNGWLDRNSPPSAGRRERSAQLYIT